MKKEDFKQALSLENTIQKTDYGTAFLQGKATTFETLIKPSSFNKIKNDKKNHRSTALNLRYVYWALAGIIVLGLFILGLLTYYFLTSDI
jgi:hypothetical protein